LTTPTSRGKLEIIIKPQKRLICWVSQGGISKLLREGNLMKKLILTGLLALSMGMNQAHAEPNFIEYAPRLAVASAIPMIAIIAGLNAANKYFKVEERADAFFQCLARNNRKVIWGSIAAAGVLGGLAIGYYSMPYTAPLAGSLAGSMDSVVKAVASFTGTISSGLNWFARGPQYAPSVTFSAPAAPASSSIAALNVNAASIASTSAAPITMSVSVAPIHATLTPVAAQAQ